METAEEKEVAEKEGGEEHLENRSWPNKHFSQSVIPGGTRLHSSTECPSIFSPFLLLANLCGMGAPRHRKQTGTCLRTGEGLLILPGKIKKRGLEETALTEVHKMGGLVKQIGDP